MTVDPLLNPVDFAKFKAKDQDWFLGAVGESIRDYCNWHIAPIISVLNVSAKIGNAGIIMLPTLNLVSVEELRFDDNVMNVGAYVPDTAGFITCNAWNYGNLNFRRARGNTVHVDFTHGFETLPKAVAEVGYELTARTLEKPAGVVKHMTRGPTDIDFLEFGVVLSDDQKNRLSPYRVRRV